MTAVFHPEVPMRRARPSKEATAALAVAVDAQAGNRGVCDLACRLSERLERSAPMAERYAQVLADALAGGVPRV